MKICPRCKLEKFRFEFHSDSAQSDGLSSRCRACKAALAREYRAKNAEKVEATKRIWREKNPHMVAAQNARGKASFPPDRLKALHRAHYERNRAKMNARDARRRSWQKLATPPWANEAEILAIYTLAREMIEGGQDVHVDHIVPLKGRFVCGLHVQNNLRIVAAAENLKKGAKLLDEVLSM